jgi:hypothetical protein
MARSRHNPSPDEIRRACEEIRSTWSEREHRRRAGWSRELVGFASRWTVPEFDARQIGLIEGQRVRGDY